MTISRLTCLSVLAVGVLLAMAMSPAPGNAQLVTAAEQLAVNRPSPEQPAGDGDAAGSSSRTLHPSPILTYHRPTQKEKLRLFEFDAFGPYAFAFAALAGGFQQASSSPREWGSGWNGYGIRVASNFGVSLVSTTTRYGLAEIFHEDAAYYPCGCTGFLRRLRHALISTVTARHDDDGRTAFSISSIAAPYVGSMTSLAWYPPRFGVKDGLEMGSYNLLGQAEGNLELEFIYGGPHSLFNRAPSSIPQAGTLQGQQP